MFFPLLYFLKIFEINKTQKLSSLMQAEIIQDIEITPEQIAKLESVAHFKELIEELS